MINSMHPYDESWRNMWNNYLSDGGPIWPEYEIMVTPKLTAPYNEQKIRLRSIVPVKKGRGVPVVEEYHFRLVTLDSIRESTMRLKDVVTLIEKHFIVEDYNTISLRR